VNNVIQLVQALVIVGAGRHGRELEYYLHDIPDAPELLGFIDEQRPAGPYSDSFVLGGFERRVARAPLVLATRSAEVSWVMTREGRSDSDGGTNARSGTAKIPSATHHVATIAA